MKRSVTFQYIALQTNLAHQFVNVSMLCNTFGGGGDTCDTTCSVNRKGTRPTLNWLHI